MPGTIAAPDLTNPALFEPTPWETYTYDPNDNAGRTDPGRIPAVPVALEHARPAPRPTPSAESSPPSPATALTRRPTGSPRRPATTSAATSSPSPTPSAASPTSALYDYANRCLRTDSLDAGIRRTIPDAAGSPIERRAGNGSLTLSGLRPGSPPDADLGQGPTGSRGHPARAADLRRVRRRRARSRRCRGRQLCSASFTSTTTKQAGSPSTTPTSRATRWTRSGRSSPTAVVAGQRALRHRLAAAAGSSLATLRGQPARRSIALTRPRRLQRTEPGRQHADRRPPLTACATRSSPPTTGPVPSPRSLSTATSFVSLAAYNARGQPTMTVYGNGLMTRCAYDPVTFRLGQGPDRALQPVRARLPARPAPQLRTGCTAMTWSATSCRSRTGRQGPGSWPIRPRSRSRIRSSPGCSPAATPCCASSPTTRSTGSSRRPAANAATSQYPGR